MNNGSLSEIAKLKIVNYSSLPAVIESGDFRGGEGSVIIPRLTKQFCGIERQDDGDREDGDDSDDDEGEGITRKRRKRIIPPLVPPWQEEKHTELSDCPIKFLPPQPPLQ